MMLPPREGTAAIGAPCNTVVCITDCPTVAVDMALCADTVDVDVMFTFVEDTPPDEIMAGTVVKGVRRTSVAVTGQFRLTVDLMSLTAV